MKFIKKNIKYRNCLYSLTYLFLLISCKSTINKETENFTCCENSNSKYSSISKNIEDYELSETLNIDILTDTSNVKMAFIPEGVFIMGASDEKWALKREYPKHRVKISSFYMDIHEVTNAQFAAFVNSTGYKTISEKPIDWEKMKLQLPPNTPKPSNEILEAGSMVFKAPEEIYNLIDFSQWWKWVKGANWKHPNGPDSDIIGLENHPVVHIAYQDALEYAKWKGKRLPTEAEWEWAARGGLKNQIYPWGSTPVEAENSKCNYWSGTFPTNNNKKDGYELTSPVMQFSPNGYGLFDMAGNVWEICNDWYDEDYYSSFKKGETANNPQGPKTWNYPREPFDPKRVIRGGSYLCNDSYCSSYRVSARMPNSQETGMSHTGFRCVKDL